MDKSPTIRNYLVFMTRIGLLSDTHGYLNPKILNFFENTDQIWHCGDIGSLDVLDNLRLFKPLRCVYGNIDDKKIRQVCKELEVFQCEEMKVFLTHIGGYPGKYPPNIRTLLTEHKPEIFACGHSHILKVMYDPKHNLLFMNPGAAGNTGFHQVITAIRFEIHQKECRNLEVLNIERK